MKSILCFGDSNLRGFIPGSFDETIGLSKRFPKSIRWTGVMQHYLGKNYDVIEEGLNGRTTIYDEIDPGRDFRNGSALFLAFLETHYPIDLVIFQLGTNDTKLQFNQTAENITEGMRQLVKIAKSEKMGPNFTTPKILVIAPQPIINSSHAHPFFKGPVIQKTEQLPELYKRMCLEENCDFLDASLIVKSSEIDGVHLDEINHKILGKAVAEKIKELI